MGERGSRIPVGERFTDLISTQCSARGAEVVYDPPSTDKTPDDRTVIERRIQLDFPNTTVHFVHRGELGSRVVIANGSPSRGMTVTYGLFGEGKKVTICKQVAGPASPDRSHIWTPVAKPKHVLQLLESLVSPANGNPSNTLRALLDIQLAS